MTDPGTSSSSGFSATEIRALRANGSEYHPITAYALSHGHMSGDERKILDFLKLNPKLFHSLNEIRRHLNRQLSCEATEEGIWPSVKRLLNKDLIESDSMCHFRFKRDTELEPLKTQLFLSPRMQQILKKTSEAVETYDITPEDPDDNLTKPPPLN